MSAAFLPAQQPISDDPPTSHEIKVTESLEAFLHSRNIIESPEQLQHRTEVLAELQSLVDEFIHEAYLKNSSNDPELVETIKAKLIPFGSLRLGVTSPSSDIDTLCVSPRCASKEDFFTILYSKFVNNPKVEDLVKRDTAYVPIITMIYDKVEIDISFARIEVDSVTDEVDLLDDGILTHLENSSVTSLNGVRVNEMMLKLIPNIESFRTVLRFIRIWAKERALYGNRYGYLGGVNMAIMCAWITQRYPKATASTLVMLFFQDLKSWPWPSAIFINTPNKGMRPSWGDEPKEKEDKMPIITPAYPCINSMRSATKSSLNRMIREFERGFQLSQKVIFEGKSWDEIVEPNSFFNDYKKFIRIGVYAGKKDSFNWYSGIVDSRIKILSLQLSEVANMLGAYLYPNMFETHGSSPDKPFSGDFFIALDYAFADGVAEKKIDITPVCQDFLALMLNQRGLKTDLSLSIEVLTKAKIPDYCFPDGKRPEPKKKKKKKKHGDKKKPT